jgi:hypothetical protein
MTVRYALADHPDGTLVTIHAAGTQPLLRLGHPIDGPRVRRSIAADLDRLSACLQAG